MRDETDPYFVQAGGRRQFLFDFMHMYVGQTLIIFMGLLFFVGWVSTFARYGKSTS